MADDIVVVGKCYQEQTENLFRPSWKVKTSLFRCSYIS